MKVKNIYAFKKDFPFHKPKIPIKLLKYRVQKEPDTEQMQIKNKYAL